MPGRTVLKTEVAEEERIYYKTLVDDDLPWDLLLDADPSEERVRSYLLRGTSMGMFSDGDLIGVVVWIPLSETTAEIMNVAIRQHMRGRGYGTILLAESVEWIKKQGFTRVELGTGNSSIDQLAFYQKSGFRIVAVHPDYFVENYPEPIYEKGIQCRDMLRLALQIT